MVAQLRLKLVRKNEQMELHVRVPLRTAVRIPPPNSSAKAGKPQILRSMTIQLNGNPVINAQMGASVADNPQFTFLFNNVQAGDKFFVQCTDDSGKELSNEITVAA